MTTFPMRGLLLGAAILFASSLPSWADTTVNVTLTGDAGEAMGIALDQTTVPTGHVRLVVKNAADMTDHEMVVIKLKDPNDQIPLLANKHRVDEDKLNSIGEVADLQPGAMGEMTAELEPGDYVLLCNIRGHYEAGMASRFTVTK